MTDRATLGVSSAEPSCRRGRAQRGPPVVVFQPGVFPRQHRMEGRAARGRGGMNSALRMGQMGPSVQRVAMP